MPVGEHRVVEISCDACGSQRLGDLVSVMLRHFDGEQMPDVVGIPMGQAKKPALRQVGQTVDVSPGKNAAGEVVLAEPIESGAQNRCLQIVQA
ncbi:Uncharacterised protein [Mycobacteroides abscessus subsp. abscessus]|nr:Uncharacterised protein [Mycobacteroides abscessus subsp. abscessus]SKV23582.1 Uncharacterised protein [Mycobacteroides abscessus subsp. abscessus]